MPGDYEINRMMVSIHLPDMQAQVAKFLGERLMEQSETVKAIFDEEIKNFDLASAVREEIRKQLPGAVQNIVSKALRYNWNAEQVLGERIVEVVQGKDEG